MKSRNGALLAGAIFMLGAPTAASAECPSRHHGKEEIVIEVEVTFQANPIRLPALSNQIVSIEYPNSGPVIMPSGEYDPANSMIERIGLVEDPEV